MARNDIKAVETRLGKVPSNFEESTKGKWDKLDSSGDAMDINEIY